MLLFFIRIYPSKSGFDGTSKSVSRKIDYQDKIEQFLVTASSSLFSIRVTSKFGNVFEDHEVSNKLTYAFFT